MAGPLNTGKQSAGSNKFDAVVRLFKPDPPAPQKITEPTEVAQTYKSYQRQVLTASIIGYATFYMVRKNLGITMPEIEKQLGVTKVQLGGFLTAHGIIYGLSKFVNGFFGDRCNARTFMVTGLVLSLLMNVFFGLSSTALWLGIFWTLNGWVQGMGFPPCARLLTHWFKPSELATKMSLWNTSHSIGAGIIVVLCGYIVHIDWRLGFFVPAAIAALVAVYLKFALPDTPESKGLPPHTMDDEKVTQVQAEETGTVPSESFKEILFKRVFTNKYIWIISLANFFIYVVRYAFLDWGPTMLRESKNFSSQQAGWLTASFEIAGIVGMLIGGVLTDKLFGGKGSRTGLFYMLACTAMVISFWFLPVGNFLLTLLVMCGIGFFIYGPQALVGVIVANLATKDAAASAVGLTGIFGYASAVLSGVGMGWMAETYGWAVTFEALTAFSIIGAVLFALAWKAPVHGYKK